MTERRLIDAILALAACLLSWLCFAGIAHAQHERLAFVVGNAAYPSPASLKNPINDANAIDKQLRGLGFETTVYKDLLNKDIPNLRRQMESRIKRDSVVVFYYAGHGIQVDGRNYLLPVDANLTDAQRAADDSIYLGDVLHAIEKTRPKLAVVILDACRDNPFRANKEYRPIKQGLARVDPPTSTVVFYATRPGGTALDGEGENGVFTQALLRELSTPAQTLEVILRRVSSSVFKASRSDQEPWIEGVIREEFVINTGHSTHEDFASTSIHASNASGPALAGPTLTSISGPEKPAQVVSLEDAYGQLRSIKLPDQETSSTFFTCDLQKCEDYKNWMKRFASDQMQNQIASFQNAVIKSKTASVCEFSLERKACTSTDVRLPFYGPNLIVSNKVYSDGFALQSTAVNKAGGLAFDATFLGGAVLYFGHKTKSNCQPAEGKINFERDRLNMEVARVTCLNNFTVSFMKSNINVLLLNHASNELIAEMDLGFFGVGFGAVVGGGKKLVRISFS